jgi:hypothetical protein
MLILLQVQVELVDRFSKYISGSAVYAGGGGGGAGQNWRNRWSWRRWRWWSRCWSRTKLGTDGTANTGGGGGGGSDRILMQDLQVVQE